MQTTTILSNKELHVTLKALVNKERLGLVTILRHIAEVDKRKLYLELAYSSLFAYLTKELSYSEGAAKRRITAARVITAHPEVISLIECGALSLCVLCKVAAVLEKELPKSEVIKLFHKVCGRPLFEVEVVLAQYKRATPSSAPVDMVTPIVTSETEAWEQGKAEMTGMLTTLMLEREVDKKGARSIGPDLFGTEVVEQVQVSFAAPREVATKLQEAKEVLSGKYPSGASLAEVLDEALEALLEAKCPKRKAARAEKRKASTTEETTTTDSRHIPAKVRAEVLKRDNYCCTFKGINGKRCSSKWDVEVDHILPYAKGGDHSPENLRTLCRAHNLFAAKQAYGVRFIDGKIADKKTAQPKDPKAISRE